MDKMLYTMSFVHSTLNNKIGWFIAVCICITLATKVPAAHGANSITVPGGHIFQGLLGRHLPIFDPPYLFRPT